jgi:ribosomal protein S18 acetylase RimI-like enzyme
MMSAVPGTVDDHAWHALAAVHGPRQVIVLFQDSMPPPAHFDVLARIPTAQYVADQPLHAASAGSDHEIVELGASDAEDMVALVELTRPGPFEIRTHLLGTYLGVRRDGRLIAMAGQRFRFPGAVEISAVCTHPDARRGGLGAALTSAAAHRIREEGATPFLHVVSGNDNAARVYEALGFRRRRHFEVTVVRTPA